MNRTTIKAILYSLALIVTFSAVNINVSAAETDSTENGKKSYTVASFDSEAEFQNLIKKYPIIDVETGKKITELKVDFSDPEVHSINQSWSLSKRIPLLSFPRENDEDSTINLSESNQMKKETTMYSEKLVSTFVNSKYYRLLENKIRLKGYIKKNQNGTYHAVIAFYRLHDSYIQTMYKTIGEFHESDSTMPNFRIKDAFGVENEEKLELKKAQAEKRNTYIKASLLVIASSAVTATIILSTKSKKQKSGEDENENNN